MDADGFLLPKPKKPRHKIQKPEDSPSPPPPIQIQTKKRKRSNSDNAPPHSTASKRMRISNVSSQVYQCPSWAEMPPKQYDFNLEVIKGGVSLQHIPLNDKSHYIFGRDQQSVDVMTAHPSCSRIHAVLQHRTEGQWFLFDFGSTHFTKLNRKKLFPHKYYNVDIGSIIQFGTSQRMYIFNGPSELQSFSESEEDGISALSSSRSKALESKRDKIDERDPSNTMKSMIHHLAEKSKDEMEQNQSLHKMQRFTASVWGMHDDDDDYNSMSSTFDETEAKQNRLTQELYTRLQSKKKQHRKVQNQLKFKESKQRSERGSELNSTECVQIEKMKSKMDDLEAEMESISVQIAQRLNGRVVIGNEKGIKGQYFDGNDAFDDDDDFYDRITTIRRKHHSKHSKAPSHNHALGRSARLRVNAKQQRMRGYDDYKKEVDRVTMKMTEIEQTMRDIAYRKRVNLKDQQKISIQKGNGTNGSNDDDDDEIDSILSDLKANDRRYNASQREFEELKHEKIAAQKMVNVLRPAYLKVMRKESEQIQMTTVSPKYIKKSGDLKKVKPGSLADIASKMKDEEREQQKRAEKERKEALQRVKEREEEIKKMKEAKLKAMRKYEEDQKRVEEKRKELQRRDKEIQNKVGLVVLDQKKREQKERKVGGTALESKFAKILGHSTGSTDAVQSEYEEEDTDTGLQNAIEEADAKWVPPEDQTGDGKTWLNEKLGY